MKKSIDVQIGEVKSGTGQEILKSNAIGSCIAIAVYDSSKVHGALAHVMLPGRSPESRKTDEKTRYAANAIDEIIAQMSELGSEINDIQVVMVGGGNVLKRPDDTICQINIQSSLKILKSKKLEVVASALGGMERRSISLDIEDGTVAYTQGNSKEILLWKAT